MCQWGDVCVMYGASMCCMGDVWVSRVMYVPVG